MGNIDWNTCRRDFEPDGGLRDIYVRDTTIEHWRMVFDMLRAVFHPEYIVDGALNCFPVVADEVFVIRNNSNVFPRCMR
jgi:hypothetical protein